MRNAKVCTMFQIRSRFLILSFKVSNGSNLRLLSISVINLCCLGNKKINKSEKLLIKLCVSLETCS